MTGTAVSAPQNALNSPVALDQAVAALVQRRREFARLPVAEKVALLRATAPLLAAVSNDWVTAACQAKEIAVDSAMAGEEWLAGPAPSARNIRLLIESLSHIGRHGRPPLGRRVRTREDGRVEVEVLPVGGWDGTLYRGLSCWVRLQPGIDEDGARQRQAAFYQQSEPDRKSVV